MSVRPIGCACGSIWGVRLGRSTRMPERASITIRPSTSWIPSIMTSARCGNNRSRSHRGRLIGIPIGRWARGGVTVATAAPSVTFGMREEVFARKAATRVVARLVSALTQAVIAVFGVDCRDEVLVELVGQPTSRSGLGGKVISERGTVDQLGLCHPDLPRSGQCYAGSRQAWALSAHEHADDRASAGAGGTREQGAAAACAGFVEDGLQVVLDGVFAEEHLRGDRAGVGAGGHVMQEFGLARG